MKKTGLEVHGAGLCRLLGSGSANALTRRKGMQWLSASMAASLWLGALAPSSGTANELRALANSHVVKASHLMRVIAHIEWPEDAFATSASSVVVGVVGAEAVYQNLSRMAPGRPVKGRGVEVLRLSHPIDVPKVHLLYVEGPKWGDWSAWAAASRSRPVVLATDAPRAIDQGATIGFVPQGDRIGLEASLPAAQQAGVKLSANFLRVADRVVDVRR